MTNNNHIVFCYGTLKAGYCNHSLLEGAVPLGKTRTVSKHTLVDWCAFPAVVLKGDTHIVGEAYRVDDAILHRLDQLEGYPGFYDRTQVELENGLTSWLYYIPEDDIDMPSETAVESGEWG